MYTLRLDRSVHTLMHTRKGETYVKKTKYKISISALYQYKLIKEYKISTGQLDRLRKNGNVNTYTLNQLCKILDCKLEDIAEYIED